MRLAAALAAVALLGSPSTAGTPPQLQPPATGCVGPSDVTSDVMTWPQALLAPLSIWPVSRGDGVLVAVLDTGVSAEAPALHGAVRRGADVDGGPADTDCRGRGTALAGIVAARPQGGVFFTGMAPGAEILPVRITDDSGRITGARIAAGIRAATSAKADVILIGAGVATPGADLEKAVRDAVAADAVVIAAVGQSSVSGTPEVAYPAAYPEVVAVNAMDADGATGAVRAEAGVDLAAPAEGAVSIAPTGRGQYSVAGAPVAAAYVAGTAALVRAYHPALGQEQVRARLELTAIPAPDGTRTPGAGAGVLDAYAAVTAVTLRQAEGAAPARPAGFTLPQPPRTPHASRVAAITALASAGIAAIAFATAVTLRRRRARSGIGRKSKER